MKITTKNFQEFIALKCFEVLKRLKTKQSLGEQQTSSTRFFNALAQAEMETSDFLEASYELVYRLIEEGNSSG